MTFHSSLLLPDLDQLRERAAEGGDLARQGALLRHIVDARDSGYNHLRQFHGMLWPSPDDNWPVWLHDVAQSEAVVKVDTLMMDSWVSSSVALRLALHTAWAADAGGLTKGALREAKDCALHTCEQYVWPMFRGRAVHCSPPGRGIELSNQVSGMLAGMLFVGHIFGYRLAKSRVARDLYLRARDAFPVLVGALDSEGYQGEGPTYQVNVEAPGLILSAELLDEVEGGDHYCQEYPHPVDSRQSRSLADFVEASMTYLFLSSGLCVPLDDYGPSRPPAGFPLAYAAHRSGQCKFLDMLAERGPFGSGKFLWMGDDLAWRMIYWPRKVAGRRWRGLGSFAMSKHFGVIEGNSGSRLLQMWDRCELMPHTHAHVNPNSITVDAFGVPVIVESSKSDVYLPFSREYNFRRAPLHSEPFVDIFRFATGDYRNEGGAVGLGAHNCVIVDGKDIAHPYWDAAGKLIHFVEGPMVSLMKSDSTAIYETCGDRLLAATRVSMLDKRCDLFVVGDDLASRTPRTYTWQAHVRGECAEIPGGIMATTREGVGLEIQGVDGASFEQRHVPSYPLVFEGESTRLRRHTEGKCAQFMHLMRPFRDRTVVADLTDGWQATLGEVFAVPEFAPESRVTARWRASLVQPAFVDRPDTMGRWITYRKTIRIPRRLRGARIFLHLPLPAGKVETDAYGLWINGDAFDTVPTAQNHFRLLDSITDITRAARFGGSNSILLQVMSSSDGGTRGRACLTAAMPGSVHAPARISTTTRGPRVRTGEGACVVNTFGPPCAGTDAVCGLVGRSDRGAQRYGALFELTHARIDGVDISADVRMSIQWDHETLWLLLPKSGCTVTAAGSTVVARRARRVSRIGRRQVQVIWQ